MITKFITILFASFLFISCNTDNSVSNTEVANIQKEIDLVCDSIINHKVLPGMLVGVWDDTKGLAYVKGFGVSDLTSKAPVTDDLLFRIGSNTKSFVITVVLQLVDEKKLSLDDKLNKFLPDFPKADKITIKMLCDMTSGIHNYTETDYFEEKFFGEPMKKWTPEEMIDVASKNDFYFEPGDGFYYSNSNTAILGYIVEEITKQPLQQVLKTRLFDKYNLTNTFFPTDNKFPKTNFIKGYMNYTDSTKYNIDVSEGHDPSWAWAAGANISNIYDVKKWVEMLIDGGMISDSLQQKRFVGKLAPSGRITYGLGIFNFTGTDMWGHNGGLDGYTSVMMRSKTKDQTIVIFYNIQGTVKPEDLYFRIYDIIN